jgi:hypothetical protein
MLRNLVIGSLVFSLTFIVGWALGFGRATPAVQVTQAKQNEQPNLVPFEPKLPFARRDTAAPPARQAAVQPQGKGLTDNDGLRRQVILWAKAYERPACNQDARSGYVIAASKYAEVLMRSAGCNNFPKCPMGEGMLGDVWRLNRNAADVSVGEAMAKVHGLGGLVDKNFRGDVGRAVRVIAGRDFSTGPGPECEQPGLTSSSGRRVRFRIR